MALWTSSGIIQALSRHRIPALVMDATVMTDGQETEAVALPPVNGGEGLTIAFEVKFASNPPGTVDYRLQLAFNNVDAEFQDVEPFMTTSEEAGDIISISGLVGRFARVKASDADTVAVTITLMCQ